MDWQLILWILGFVVLALAGLAHTIRGERRERTFAHEHGLKLVASNEVRYPEALKVHRIESSYEGDGLRIDLFHQRREGSSHLDRVALISIPFERVMPNVTFLADRELNEQDPLIAQHLPKLGSMVIKTNDPEGVAAALSPNARSFIASCAQYPVRIAIDQGYLRVLFRRSLSLEKAYGSLALVERVRAALNGEAIDPLPPRTYALSGLGTFVQQWLRSSVISLGVTAPIIALMMVLIVNGTVFAPDLFDQVFSSIPERWVSADSIMTIIGTLIGLFSAVTSALGITLAITRRWALIFSALYAAPYAFGAVALTPVFGMSAAIYMMAFIYVFSMGFVWLTYRITRTKP